MTKKRSCPSEMLSEAIRLLEMNNVPFPTPWIEWRDKRLAAAARRYARASSKEALLKSQKQCRDEIRKRYEMMLERKRRYREKELARMKVIWEAEKYGKTDI